MMWGICIGLVAGALLMSLAVEEVEKEKEHLEEANADLRYENEEQQEFINKVIRIMFYEKSIFDRDKKIKELILEYQSEN